MNQTVETAVHTPIPMSTDPEGTFIFHGTVFHIIHHWIQRSHTTVKNIPRLCIASFGMCQFSFIFINWITLRSNFMTELYLLSMGRWELRQSFPVYLWVPSHLLCGLRRPSWEGCRATETGNQASHYGCSSEVTVNRRSSFSFCPPDRLLLNSQNAQDLSSFCVICLWIWWWKEKKIPCLFLPYKDKMLGLSFQALLTH